MALMMVTAQLEPETVAEVDAAIDVLFAALDQAQPEGVRYASTRLPDGLTAVILLQIEDGRENPLPSIPEFIDFQQRLKAWVAGPAETQPLTVKGSYRLF